MKDERFPLLLTASHFALSKERAAVILSCDHSNIHSGFKIVVGGGGVGREGLAVYLGKKCNERLGIVSFRFE